MPVKTNLCLEFEKKKITFYFSLKRGFVNPTKLRTTGVVIPSFPPSVSVCLSVCLSLCVCVSLSFPLSISPYISYYAAQLRALSQSNSTLDCCRTICNLGTEGSVDLPCSLVQPSRQSAELNVNVMKCSWYRRLLWRKAE